MSIVLKHAQIYTGLEVIHDGYIRFDKQIEAIGPMSDYRAKAGDQVEFVSGKKIVPGFIDVHTHGGYGLDTMDGNADEIDTMVNKMIHEGITTIFPTTMTQSDDAIAHAMQGVAAAAKKNPVIKGVHLEGPFIAAIYKGAQPEKYIKDPDPKLLDHWNELSNHLVRLITYAPEDKIVLVTDSMRAKGMPEGESELGGQRVIVKDKQARLESGNLAGSVLTFNDAFKNAIAFMDCSIEDAVKMASVNQATEFGLEDKGTLEVGKDADLNVMNSGLDVQRVYSYGRRFDN